MSRNERKSKTNDGCEQDHKDIEASVADNQAQEQEPENYTLTREQMQELKEAMQALQNERDEYLASAQRVQAEFDNYRKRTASIRIDSMQEGVAESVLGLLPVLDNLERALDVGTISGESGAFIDGVTMVCRQFVDELKKQGVAEIDAQGKPFDPEKHNAVAQCEPEDEQESGIVQEVYLKGYEMGNKVIRHSMVKVTQ